MAACLLDHLVAMVLRILLSLVSVEGEHPAICSPVDSGFESATGCRVSVGVARLASKRRVRFSCASSCVEVASVVATAPIPRMANGDADNRHLGVAPFVSGLWFAQLI